MYDLNLGVIKDPCLIFGGAYSNLQATEAVLDAAEKLNIPGDRIFCTGDLVAYCADPKATVDLIRSKNIHVIMGNCEESLSAYSGDCGCGYETGSTCDVLSVRWYQYTGKILSDKTKNWMGQLPYSISFEMAGCKFKVIHGAVSSINRFIFPSTATHIKQEELKLAKVDCVISGHSGLPFSQMIGNCLWHNAGVIGMPANDCTTRVWYSVLTHNGNQIEVEHCPLIYDFKKAADSMRRNNLPEEYAKTLGTGIWATDNIMPAQDRRLRGKQITAQKIFWTIELG